MSTNVTVSNISPTLSYIPRTLWFEGSADDPELSSYINQSYHATNGTLGQASVSFTWYGSGIWIYGGYRQRLGPYEVVLDGKATPFPGFTGGPEQVPAVLFSESGLQPVEHQIQVINTGQDPQMSVLDINYLVMETPAAQVMTLDDSGVGYSWLPSGSQAWESDSQSHTTHNSVASVQLSFMGHGVSVFGAIGPDNAPFSVSIDGKLTQTLYTNTQLAPLVNTSHLLYSSLGLVSGSHTLLIQNNPLSASNATLDVDYALVLYDPASPEPTSNHVAVIAACVSAGVCTVVLVLIWQLCARRHRVHTKHTRERTPRPFLQFAPSSSAVRLVPRAASPTSPGAPPTSTTRLVFHPPTTPTGLPDPAECPRLHRSFVNVTSTRRRPPPPPAILPPPDAALPAPPPAASVAPPPGRADKVGSPKPAKNLRSPDAMGRGWPDDQLPPPYRFQDLH